MKNTATSFYRKHRFVFSIVFVLMSFVFGLSGLVVANGEVIDPADSHVVSVYADGKEYSIPSRARTVGELLDRAAINVSEHDIVEPATEAPITIDGFRIRVIRARPYVVRDGEKELSALTAHTSARLIAEAAGLALKPADIAEFAPIEEIDITEIGRVIDVVRSKTILVSIYGTPSQVNTNSATVRELLEELSVSPAGDDEISPALDTSLVDGSRVFINRNGIKVITEEVAIEPTIEYVQDDTLTLGSSVTRDPGKPGKRVVTYEITTQNDTELSRKEISSITIEQPIKKIVARGRAAGQIGAEKEQLMAAAGISPEEYGAVNYIIGQESGWCATKWQGQWGQCPSFYVEKFDGAEESSALGYGLCQSTPAIKMASSGSDWRTNPVTQIKWCYDYILKYGSAQAAADFKQCLGECYSPRTRSTVFKKTTWF
jgi:uncharacterized protein YabE (DUF348 family)